MMVKMQLSNIKQLKLLSSDPGCKLCWAHKFSAHRKADICLTLRLDLEIPRWSQSHLIIKTLNCLSVKSPPFSYLGWVPE